MKEILEEIKKLDDMDQKPISESMCKLFEELGEFTQEVNKMIGMKVHNETHSEIREKTRRNGRYHSEHSFDRIKIQYRY